MTVVCRMRRLSSIVRAFVFCFQYGIAGKSGNSNLIGDYLCSCQSLSSPGHAMAASARNLVAAHLAGGIPAFLFYARTAQTGVPLDLRMLAVAFPFLLLAMAPAVNPHFPIMRPTSERCWSYCCSVCSLIPVSMKREETHDNYASAGYHDGVRNSARLSGMRAIRPRPAAH